MTSAAAAAKCPTWVSRIDSTAQALGRHWLLGLNLALGVWTGLPWLAPLFMHLNWQRAGRLIYSAYALVCHQLPERSWFLFGDSFTLSIARVEALSGIRGDHMTLRTFVGNSTVGWKLGWSDRMVSFYSGWLLASLLCAALRGRTRGLGWRVGLALMAPMALDGLSHMVSDLLGGTDAGFREANAWLAALTMHGLGASFYAGNAWGSFNSLARLVTGLLAAFGLILWLLPELDRLTGRLPARALRP